MTFREIPQFVEDGGWECNTSIFRLDEMLTEWEQVEGLDMNPDFQRGHVWTRLQQQEYVKFFLGGGKTGKTVYFNKPSWQSPGAAPAYDDFVIVDGLQRLTALREFATGKLQVFGQYADEFGKSILCPHKDSLKINVNTLKTKKEVLTWYVQMNAGGTPHSPEEIARVQAMITQYA